MPKLHGSRRGITVPVQSVYEESEFAKAEVGDILPLGDRAFVYCRNGSLGISLAYMTSALAVVGNHIEIAQTAYGLAKGAVDVEVLVAGTAVTQDQYKDGYLIVNEGTGLGQIYRIKSHDTSAGGAAFDVTLFDDIITAVPAASDISLLANPFRDVVVFPVTEVGPATGVPLIDVTAEYYFWAQIKGLAGMIVDSGDNIVVGNNVGVPGTYNDPGAVGVPTAGTNAVWGTCRLDVATPQAAGIMLNGLGWV